MTHKNIQFIVHVWLDVEALLGVSKKKFAIELRDARWVKKRLAVFKKYTLRSLLNQEFDDFRIFLFCGLRNRKLTESFDFGTDRVERFYDFGRKEYAKIRKPFVSVMRIDSDDLFHRNLMWNIRKKIRPHEKAVTSFSVRRVIQWNVLQHFLSDFVLPVSPFTNHVFPRSLYRDWNQFKILQFGGYRSAPDANLPRQSVCIVRHKDNVTWKRIGKDPGSEKYKREEFRKRNNLITSRDRMIRILGNYGIPGSMVKHD